MSKTATIFVIIGTLALVLLTFTAMGTSEILVITDTLIPKFEGFSATPYWDVSRYSWGYGTPAPGSTGTITKAQAVAAMQSVVKANYNKLAPLITRQLTSNQWGALMSFSYNEGEGNGEHLVDDINAGDDAVLETHWKEYIYADHVVNNDLVDRRNQEWAVWQS